MKTTYLLRGIITCMMVGALSMPSFADDASLSAKLLGKKGKEVGTVTLREGPHGVLVHIKASELSPGAHGVHFHRVGNCDAHEHFKTAAGHITGNLDTPHGLLNEDGRHVGDLPNIYAHEDGTAQAEFFADGLTISRRGGKPALADEDGAALMIHEAADDHRTQPIGGAGGRVACAVIPGVPETP